MHSRTNINAFYQDPMGASVSVTTRSLSPAGTRNWCAVMYRVRHSIEGLQHDIQELGSMVRASFFSHDSVAIGHMEYNDSGSTGHFIASTGTIGIPAESRVR